MLLPQAIDQVVEAFNAGEIEMHFSESDQRSDGWLLEVKMRSDPDSFQLNLHPRRSQPVDDYEAWVNDDRNF